MFFNQPSRRTAGRVLARTLALSGAAWAVAFALGGTSFIPISDAELSRRADVVVHGIVISNSVKADRLGRPETVSVIAPLSVLKGTLRGTLVLHQLGGQLPDGRFFQMWGRPEYVPGSEVIVFAIARRGGDFETAEMLLGKFEVWSDEEGNRYAIPALSIGSHPGVDVVANEGNGRPRGLQRFLAFLEGRAPSRVITASPRGKLSSRSDMRKRRPGRPGLCGETSITASGAGTTTRPRPGRSTGRRTSTAAASPKQPALSPPGRTTRTRTSTTRAAAGLEMSSI